MCRLAFVVIAAILAVVGTQRGVLAETSTGRMARATADKPPEGGEGRYTFNRVQDGYLRLDNRTGQVSLCSKRAVGWGCQLAPEDRGAFESEIARLQDENAALKRDLLARGLALPGNVRPPEAAQRDPALRMPSDAQLERMRSIVESAWRRLVEMIANLQRDVLKKS